MRRFYAILIILSMLLSMGWGSFFAIDTAQAGTPVGSLVSSVTYASNSSADATVGSYLVSSVSSKAVTFNVPANAGKVIKSLIWYDSNGNSLRAVTGDWLNKTSFNGQDIIQGTQVNVKAAGNNPYGGIYYWSRSGGSNTWKSDSPDGVKYTNSDACPAAPKDEWGLKAYPNCTDDRLKLTLTKSQPYTVVVGQPIGIDTVIPDKAIDTKTMKPVDVKADLNFQVRESMTGQIGYADSSTRYLGTYEEATTQTQVTIRFEQTFGPDSITDGYYRDFVNPGARQIWYYSAFTFAFEATTYLYKDKYLYVEWGDPEGTDPCKVNPTAPGCSPGPTDPPTYNITGDFDIIPSEIEYRESFALKPKNFVIPTACTYVNHRYIIRRDGDYSLTNYETNRTQTTSYSYSTYPNIIGVGSHVVELKITATCDGKTIETEWLAAKTLMVNGPSRNSPPVFDAGFFRDMDLYSFDPLGYVAVNSMVNLRIINDPRTDPAKPYDPDGDPIYWYWDFAGSDSEWIRSFPTEFGTTTGDEYHLHLYATELGRHCIKVTGRDPYGASTIRTVCINVVPPNPIPVISGPASVVEGRPLPSNFDGSNSFSPMGRSISQYIWGNVKNVYTVPGTEYITLEVIDSGGLRSLPEDMAVHALTVKPDLPPIPELEYVNIGIRNSAMHFQDNSYSPDGDQIVEHTVKLVCDANNNGSFTDDVRKTITANASGEFDITPTTVGTCAVEIYLKEDWGKIANKQFIFNVVNLEPEADFSALSVNPEPPEITAIAPTMGQLMGTGWTSSGSKEYILNTANNTLETRGFSNLQPYKSITTSNLVKTEQKIHRSYCGNCGNTGSTSGYYYIFSPAYRVDQRLWDASSTYYSDFYYEDRTETSSWPAAPILSHLSAAFDYYGYGNKRFVNTVTGVILVRVGPRNTYNYTHTWTDYFFRISELKTSTTINPYLVKSSYVNSPSGKQTMPNEVPEPPLPAEFVMPQVVTDGVSMEALVSRSDGTALPSKTSTSNFNKDRLGNVYKNICTTGTWYDNVENCKLAKYSSAGQALWQVNASSATNQMPAIEYIASDNSKLVVKGPAYPSKYYILNNANGSTILSFVAAVGYDFTSGAAFAGNGNYYMGVYDDVVAYIVQTVESGTLKISWELKFYNMVTGQTTSAGIIKTYSGKSRTEYYGIYTYTISATPGSVISSDGKLIIANYYTNILVYDMKTFAKVADIPVNAKDPENVNASGEENGSYYSATNTYSLKGLSLTEDGRLKVVYRNVAYDRSQGNNSDEADDDDDVYETAVTIQTTPSSAPSFSYGYISSQDEMVNGDLLLKVMFKKDTFSNSLSAGVGFRSQDNKNMYRVELSTGKVSLIKIVNGASSTVASYSYKLKAGTTYDLKVKARGEHIVVYVNGVPLIDKTDSTYASGKFGLFAEVPYVLLKDFSATLYEAAGEDVENQAIVNMPITYNSSYTDPEKDPRIADKTTWVFTNVQPYKFLDVGDGTSDAPGHNTYDNVKVKQPGPSLSKVGIYKVDFSETDDPAPAGYEYPNAAFEEFRKQSYPATHYIVVHRRPVAEFTLSISTADHTVVWDDQSYDPDRWLSATKYSTEATGINYQTTRGVVDRKYYYIAPNGTSKNMKLIAPSETGTYTVGLAVKDEYGAWSDWAEAEIEVAMPVIDEPPTPGFTLSKTTLFRGEALTIKSTAHDKEDGAAANLSHQYYMKNTTDGSADTLQSSNRGTWTKVFDALGIMSIRQVVCDSKGQCAQLSKTVNVVNRPPQADFDWLPKPVYDGDTIAIVSSSADPDNDDLTFVWTISGPGGYAKSGSSPNLVLNGGDTANRPGTYRVTLVVRDQYGAEDTAVRDIVVHELGIQGMVRHTDDWDNNRLRYNDKYPDAARPYDWFWAGEAFVLAADVTDTGSSATKPVAVEARAPHNLMKALTAEGAELLRWQGLLRSSDAGFPLEELPQGPLTFTFTVTYSNGVVKTSQVTITLRNTIDSFVQVHRVQ